jgi:hypothetical protein
MNTANLAAVVLCLSSAACTAHVAPSEGTPAEGTLTASAAPGDWSCLEAGGTLLPAHPAPLGPSRSLFVHAVEAYSYAGVPGLTVRACDAADTGCAAPLASAEADETGTVTLTLSGTGTTFDGYLAFAGAGQPANLVFLDGRSPTDGVYVLEVYTEAALALTASFSGVTLDPTRAMVRVDARDCSGAAAFGVGIGLSTSDADTLTTYLTDDGRLASSDAATTGASGIAFAFGVLPEGLGVREAFGPSAVGGAIAFAHPGAVTSVVALPWSPR